MSFSVVKICFRAKVNLVFHWCYIVTPLRFCYSSVNILKELTTASIKRSRLSDVALIYLVL